MDQEKIKFSPRRQILLAMGCFIAATKIVMCTAMGQEGMVVDAIKSGAKDFIVKPFNADRIVQTVNTILGQ